MSSFSVAAPLPGSPAAVRLAASLVIIWLTAMAALLWHFEQSRIAGSRQLLHFDARDLPDPPAGASGVAKVLYFVDRHCRCSDAALADIARIRRDTSVPYARFAAAPNIEAITPADPEVRPLSAAESARWERHAPAVPAAAVWDERDRLIYFGPINVTSGCGSARSHLWAALQNLSRQQGLAAVFQSWDVVVACTCAAPVRSVHS